MSPKDVCFAGLRKIGENQYELEVVGTYPFEEAIIDVVHCHEETVGRRDRDRVLAILPKRTDGGILYGFRYENSHCEVEGRSPICELHHNHKGGSRIEKSIVDVLGDNLKLDEKGKGKIEMHIFD